MTYDDPEGRREKAKLMARIEREEELKARGLDPRVGDQQPGEVRLVLPSEQLGGGALPEADTAQAPAGGGRGGRGASKEGSAGLQSARLKLQKTGTQSKATLGPANDRDLPPSTPLPPPLNVPIVTHTSKASTEGQPVLASLLQLCFISLLSLQSSHCMMRAPY